MRLSFFSAPFVAVLATALAAVGAGCSDGATPAPTETATSQTAAPLVADTAFANDKAAFEYFIGKGLTNFQAAGIVGNLDQESGVDPNSVQGGGPGRGIAQWSVGGRWDTGASSAVAFAARQGVSVHALQTQLDFIWYELTTFTSYGLGALKASTNVTQATIAFERDYEGCGTCAESTRLAYAQSVLAAYGATLYDAQFVSQSFPRAATPLTMTEGQTVSGYIELKNTGARTWDSSTRLATTQARDRASAFVGKTWLSPSRAAAVKGTVPPGGTYKFAFDLTAPAKTGTYAEFFGVVQEGVAWFSDPGQGGPADDVLEVKIDVVAPPPGAPPPPPPPSGPSADAGGAAAEPTPPAGPRAPEPGGTTPENASSGGCQVSASRDRAPPWALGLLGLAALVRAGRTKRPRRSA